MLADLLVAYGDGRLLSGGYLYGTKVLSRLKGNGVIGGRLMFTFERIRAQHEEPGPEINKPAN
jgi:hypothetical protein